jgi:hypothetical protein
VSRVALFALVLALTLGCSPRKTLFELGFGSFSTDLSVVGVAEHGPYLEAHLEGHGLALGTFVRADAVCRRVLAPDARVDYVERGIAGRFEREGERCEAVGIGAPLIERARHPRGGSLRTTPIPREQATFRLVHRDEDLWLARGRFPLAAAVGWAGGEDSVAAFPNTPVCRAPLERGVASMEYRGAGRPTLSLVGEGGPCPFVGLLLPLDFEPAPSQ